MKHFIMLLAALLTSLPIMAQRVEYKTFIYTSEELADDISMIDSGVDDSRGLGSDLLNATLGAVSGIGTGYISTFVDMGINALGSLITRNSRLRKEWEETVKKENSWNTHISSVQDVRDFYLHPSTAGALDPQNMIFDGIGCLRTEGPDTLFFISCHIDRSKLNRIVNHSKFELVLDTLIVSPYHSNLPNTNLPLDFSFDERRNFNLGMKIKLSSSWFTDAIELHNNADLGEFTVNIPVAKEELDEKGFLRYVRTQDQESKYKVVGESFIVPRSYMGYRDPNGKYRNIWGTGQYKLDIELTESCDITPEYRAEWKEDRKKRKKMMPRKGFLDTVWQTISSQKWDELAKSWVITTISAPAGVLQKELKQVVTPNGSATNQSAKMSGAGASQSANKGGAQQGGMNHP